MKNLFEDGDSGAAFGATTTDDMAQFTPKIGRVEKRQGKNPVPFGKGKEMEAKKKKKGHGVKRFKKWLKDHRDKGKEE